PSRVTSQYTASGESCDTKETPVPAISKAKGDHPGFRFKPVPEEAPSSWSLSASSIGDATGLSLSSPPGPYGPPAPPGAPGASPMGSSGSGGSSSSGSSM